MITNEESERGTMIDKQSGSRTDSDDRTQTVTITWTEYASLLEARTELDRLKNGAPTTPDIPNTPLVEVVRENPDLVDWQGLSSEDAAFLYGEYETYYVERDCD